MAEEKWSGEIELPEIKLDQQKIGKNLVTQLRFGGAKIPAKLFDCETPGHDLLVTSLPSPYNKILFKKRNAKVLATYDMLCLGIKEIYDSQTSLDGMKLKWENVDIILNNALIDPALICKSWSGQLSFTRENTDTGKVGLRGAQLGALHASIAHFSIGDKFEPATIVLPTGTGKTETMLASMIFNCTEKLLVLVPSNALRLQIFKKFTTLGFLPLIDVVPTDIQLPRVLKIEVGIKDENEALEILSHSNVIIATPDILNASDPLAVGALCNGCTELFIDEAHHSPATTWDKIRSQFLSKKILQFTATPFRNDGKHVGGKIIFNYKLGDAQEDGYFKPIRLHTIEEWGETERRNLIIAQKAVSILRQDLEAGFDHLIMARVNGISKVGKVFSIYQRIASEFNPVFVHSKGNKEDIDTSMQAIFSRESRIIICVDMLGEGFDLPNLKIAAIHDGHKSLAISLQFIGRFTRTSSRVGDAAAVINIADPQIEKNLRKLYSEGANWDKLLKRFSEEQIEREINLQDIILSLRENGTLSEEISLWNLSPSFTTTIYRTTCDMWNPEAYQTAMHRSFEHWHAISQTNNVLVVLSIQSTSVKWGNFQELIDTEHKLLIAYWNQSENALFIYSSDYKGFNTESLVGLITDGTASLISGPSIFNILNNVELPLVKNLGTSKLGAISFTSYFGSNVTDGLTAIDKNESELNNIACIGYEDGDRVLWGGTQKKGKIWSVKSGTISEWIEWCNNTWLKVSDEEQIETSNIIRDFLKPVKLESRYEGVVTGVQWGERVQFQTLEGAEIWFNEVSSPIFMIDLGIIEENNSIKISITSETHQSVYEFSINNTLQHGYKYELIEGEEVFFKFGKKAKIPLIQYMISDPFILYYHDGTYSYNNYHIPISLNAGELSIDSLETIDWSDIPLNAESMGKTINQNTIQYKTFKHLEDSFEFIFNDDGPGESADLVCIKSIDAETIGLTLVHCKNAKGAKLSTEIDNFYTVCGQAQKCIRVKHSGMSNLAKKLRKRHAKWSIDSHTRFLKGEHKELAYFEEKARKAKIQFEVILVQPGLKKENATPDILKLLACTESYLQRTTKAHFRVICS